MNAHFLENRKLSLPHHNDRITIILHLVLVFLEIIGLVYSAEGSGAALFMYYTQDSNILSLIASWLFLVFALTDQRIPGWVHTLRYTATCCLTLTFGVVFFAFVPLTSIYQMFIRGAALYHHLLCPILALIACVGFEHDPPLTNHTVWQPVILTLIYAFIAIILNGLGIWNGPYPFLKIGAHPLWISAAWFARLILSVFLIAVGLLALNRHFDH